MWRGILVFAITYVLVATRRLRVVRIDRPAGALTGAVLAVALGAVTAEQAALAVDQTTIILLFAVMGSPSWGWARSCRSTASSNAQDASSSLERGPRAGSSAPSCGARDCCRRSSRTTWSACSTFAGNLTLLGSVANVIVAEKARDVGGLRFGEHLEIGVPVATLTTLVGAAMLVAMRGWAGKSVLVKSSSPVSVSE